MPTVNLVVALKPVRREFKRPSKDNCNRQGDSRFSTSRAVIEGSTLLMDFLRERDLLDRLDVVALRGANCVFGKHREVVGNAGVYADVLVITSCGIRLGTQ